MRTVAVFCSGGPEFALDAHKKAQESPMAAETAAGAGASPALVVAGELGAAALGSAGGGVASAAGLVRLGLAGLVLVIGVPIGLTVGLVAGAISARAKMVGPKRAEQIAASVTPALAGFPFPAALSGHIAAAGSRSTGWAFVDLVAGPASAGLLEQTDAILETTAVTVSLEQIEKALQIVVAARARLVEKDTGTILRLGDFAVAGRAFAKTEAPSGDETLANTEIDGYLAALSEQIVDALLLMDDHLSTVYWGSALWPDKPRPRNRRGYAPRAVDSERPTLEWTPFPGPREREEDSAGRLSEIGGVAYDLRIWRVLDDQHRLMQLVYEREALPDPWHTVEQSLEADTLHYWAVRARFAAGGSTVVTRWTMFPVITAYLYRDPFNGALIGPYGFRTPPSPTP